MKILLLQLEFSRWQTAKPWSYASNFAIAQSLRDQGIETVTIPIIPDQKLKFHQSWLGRAKEICQGMKFDQVWVWLLHYPYEPETLEWIEGLAPVRIGILVESMQYDEEDYLREPRLQSRPAIVKQQVKGLTHVLVSDENDVEEILSWNSGPVQWWPCGVPERFIVPPRSLAQYPRAVFHGTLYEQREVYLSQKRLHTLLAFPTPNMCQNQFQCLFDDIQREMERVLELEGFLGQQDLLPFITMLDQARHGEFTKWMEHLQSWAAIVNLPSYAKFYGGRVFEGMAAGRPVISWKIPRHPKNHELFQDGEEILLFPKDDPEALAHHIERLLGDAGYTAKLVNNAQRTLREFHTVEKRVRDVLRWVESGVSPRYGRQPDAPMIYLNPRNMAGECPGTPNGTTVVENSSEEKLPENQPPQSISEQGLSRWGPNKEEADDMAGHQSEQRRNEDQFYADLFVRSGTWSTAAPNTEERQRWEKIKEFLPVVIQQLQQSRAQPIRILDVGCGRGWLTNLLSQYGQAEGVEPVEAVVEHARQLFPHLHFYVGFPESLLTRKDFEPYDLIVTSEVIEHIPHARKATFLRTLQRLLKADGAIILSTPRKEVWDQWRVVSTPNQPVEDWIAESDLLQLFQGRGFRELGRERIYFDLHKFEYVPSPSMEDTAPSSVIALYQVWAFGIGALWQDHQGHSRVSGGGFSPIPAVSHDTHPLPDLEKGPVLETSQTRSRSPQSHTPLVSVIVPTFNRPTTLKMALESILRQTLTDYEIIVVNDAGTDIEPIVASYNSSGTVTSIRHARNRGLAAARNSGIGVARGKYIAYLDDDDRFGPRHLEVLVEFLEHNPFQAAYTDAWRVWQTNENGRMVDVKRDVPYSREFNPDLLLLSNYFPVLCMMHEKQCLEVTGGFDESLTTHEDWDLWIRLSRHYPFAHIKDTTAEFTWRMDGSSMTSEKPEDFLRTKTLIYQKYDSYFRARPHLIPFREEELKNLQQRVNKTDFDCSIIIPVFNRVDLTQQCLIHLSETIAGCSYEVIVVDNASTDGTADYLASLSGDLRIIRNQHNLGFAKACNQGAAVARGQYLVFLNNDTIPQPGWLEPLVQEVQGDAQVGIVGSKLLFPDGRVQHAGVVFSRFYGEPYHLFLGSSPDIPGINRRRELQAVTAACMLVRKTCFEEVGGFDEGFLNGFEDVDFCLRIRQCGMKVIYQPNSQVYHLESQTEGRKTHDVENSRRLKDKWSGQWTEDEDMVAFHEGYVIQQTFSGPNLNTSLVFRESLKDSVLWERVAEMQRLLLGQQKGPLSALRHREEIYALLQEVDSWPCDIGILEWAGRVAETVCCSNEARQFWERLLTLGDHPHARLGLARLALQEQDMARAAIHLNVLRDEFPGKVEGWVLRGIFCIQEQRYAEARIAFHRALTLDEHDRRARLGMSLTLMGLEEWRSAWEMCEQLFQEFPDDVEIVKVLIQAGTGLEAWDKLGKSLSRYVDRNPTDCDMRFALAGVLIRADQLSQAEYHYAALLTLKPDLDGLRELQARLSQSAGPVYAMAK